MFPEEGGEETGTVEAKSFSDCRNRQIAVLQQIACAPDPEFVLILFDAPAGFISEEPVQMAAAELETLRENRDRIRIPDHCPHCPLDGVDPVMTENHSECFPVGEIFQCIGKGLPDQRCQECGQKVFQKFRCQRRLGFSCMEEHSKKGIGFRSKGNFVAKFAGTVCDPFVDFQGMGAADLKVDGEVPVRTAFPETTMVGNGGRHKK